MTLEQKEMVESMWKAGASLTKIAMTAGVSRGAVMGHITRNRILRPQEASGSGTGVRLRFGERRPPTPISCPAVEHSAPVPVPIWDLGPHHCRWIIGDPKDAFGHRYCGDQRLPESAYCDVHHKRSVVCQAVSL